MQRNSEASVIKDHLYREPNGSFYFWILIFLGIGELAYSFLIATPDNWFERFNLTAVGLLIIVVGAAEVLPRTQTTLAGLLRIVSYALLLLVLVVFVIAIIS